MNETAENKLAPEEKLTPVLDALAEAYGVTEAPERDPMQVLVRGILSQNTSDVNSDRAYESLRDRFPAWSDIAQAEEDAVRDSIRSGGLAEQKAKTIKAVMEMFCRNGGASLDELSDMKPAEAEEELTAIKGIGIKTARLVLLFGFGWPVFVVDTHVHRVSRRLRLVPENATRAKSHVLLDDLIPDARKYEAHINFIRHGRECCRARNPLCDECPVTRWCVYFHEM